MDAPCTCPDRRLAPLALPGFNYDTVTACIAGRIGLFEFGYVSLSVPLALLVLIIPILLLNA